MLIHIRNADTVEISGYVNAVERNSKPIRTRMGTIFERIKKGAFARALKRNDDVHILLNHNPNRDLGSTKSGNLELEEDSIGLKARAIISDKEVVQKASQNDLIGWSFGFLPLDNSEEIEISREKGIPVHEVTDLDLYEVSILDRTHTPAYEGNSIMTRDEKMVFLSDTFEDKITVEKREVDIEKNAEEVNENVTAVEDNEANNEANETNNADNVGINQAESDMKKPEVNTIDYSKVDSILKQIKEETINVSKSYD